MNVLVDENSLKGIGDAIRAKRGNTTKLKPSQMADAISHIETGSDPVLQEKSVSPTESAQPITADSGYDGLSKVNVGAISNTYVGSAVARQSAQTITPTTTTQTVVGSGKYTTGDVKVAGDANLVSANIKAGTSIFGVSGATNVVDTTSSITPTAGQIALNRVAYANGKKITGTAPLLTDTSVKLEGDNMTVASGFYMNSVSKSLASLGAMIIPTEELEVIANGAHDVTNYASVLVDVADTPKRANENLLLESYNRGTSTTSGITRTYIGDCTYKISGTSTASVDLALYTTLSVPVGYYTMSIVGDTSKLTDCYVSVGTSTTTANTVRDEVSKNQVRINVGSGQVIRYIGIHIPSGVTINTDLQFKLEAGSTMTDWIPNPADSGGGGGDLPSGFSKIATGSYNLASSISGSGTFTVTHNLGVTPDLFMIYPTTNIATTYSMLYAFRSAEFGWRSSSYVNLCGYHGNSTTTVTSTNVTTSYGIKTLNTTQAVVTAYSTSTSYYWRAGNYKWIAIKFS